MVSKTHSKTESFVFCEGEISEVKHAGCVEKCFLVQKETLFWMLSS